MRAGQNFRQERKRNRSGRAAAARRHAGDADMALRKRALPDPLPEGFILTDAEKKRWKLGRIIGQGGFGLIHLASQDVHTPVAEDTDFVIKVEYQENGPLFSELKFYQRAAKPEIMQTWTRSKKLNFLGIPSYWGSGLAEHNGTRYRFMAMDRLGIDLQKVCEGSGGQLKRATVLQLGLGLVDVLEYIHDNEYVHADIKAANLMLGHRDPDKVFLADYGLSYRYCPNGVHKDYKENPKKGHNGTIEYTSLDAHNGVAPSRRGDLQILGFCLLHWLCGTLPWDSVLKSPTQVHEAKTMLMDNLPGSVQQLSTSGASTDEIARFLDCVRSLGYQERPDYQRLRELLVSSSLGRLDFSRPHGEVTARTRAREPPAQDKKAGRARGRFRPQTVLVNESEEEQETRKPRSNPARYVRGPPVRTPPSEQKVREDVATKAKQVDARYIRGPPVNTEVGARKALARIRISSDEEDNERTEHMAARHLRAPPVGQQAVRPKRRL